MSTELKKALTTTGDGAALLPYTLEAALNEELLRLQPLAVLINVVNAEGKTHEYNLRTSHPQGWFEGETTPANNKNSAYARRSVQLKIQRGWGSVTGFTQAMDKKFIDALASELTGTIEGMSNVLEFGTLWGASTDLSSFTGDGYQYSGIFPTLAAKAPANIIDGAGAKISLDLMDQAYAKITSFRNVRNDPKVWLMGLRMKQVVDGLQTRVSIPLTSTVLRDGALTMANYSGAPIYETDYLVPASTTSSPAATAAKAAGGALAAETYKYQIASVTMEGEQVAGTESSGVTTETTNLKVNLTWTADPLAKNYMIFRKTGSGAYKLIDIIPALTYDSSGTVNGVVEAYSDDGSKTGISQVRPLASGEQNIMIVNTMPDRGLAFLGKVDDMGRPIDNLFNFVELARVKDTYDYMVKGYLALRVKYPNVAAAMIRNVKTA